MKVGCGHAMNGEYMAMEPVNIGIRSLIWMSPARFDQLYPAEGDDQALGASWGPRYGQTLLYRRAETSHGILYVHDPIWNERAVINATIEPTTVATALDEVTANFGRHGASIEVIRAIVADHITFNRQITQDAASPAYLGYGIDLLITVRPERTRHDRLIMHEQ
jgi:hypothetical protein